MPHLNKQGVNRSRRSASDRMLRIWAVEFFGVAAMVLALGAAATLVMRLSLAVPIIVFGLRLLGPFRMGRVRVFGRDIDVGFFWVFGIHALWVLTTLFGFARILHPT